MTTYEKTLDKMEDYANGTLLLSKISDSDLSNILVALDKQIPKKPIYSDYDENELEEIVPYKATCPFCGYEFEFGYWNEYDNHHCVCGQSIDWREQDE